MDCRPDRSYRALCLTSLSILLLTLLIGCTATPTQGPTEGPTQGATPTISSVTPAETQTTPTSVPVLAGPFVEEDLILTIDGLAVSLLNDAAPALAMLGDGYVMSEAESCLFEGMDRTFDFEYLQIFTIPKGQQDLVDGIYLLDDRYGTARGIHVGDPVEDVIAAYGPMVGEDRLLYNIGGDPEDISQPSLTFLIEEGKVSAISYYSASNSQGA